MMPSVKGLHYALRIWTRQIFGLVIMMLYPLPNAGTGGPTPDSVFLLPTCLPPIKCPSCLSLLTYGKSCSKWNKNFLNNPNNWSRRKNPREQNSSLDACRVCHNSIKLGVLARSQSFLIALTKSGSDLMVFLLIVNTPPQPTLPLSRCCMCTLVCLWRGLQWFSSRLKGERALGGISPHFTRHSLLS